jgi:hypothetical protein
MKGVVKDFVIVFLLSLATSLVVTIIYKNTPNFYINTFNVAIVPNLEQNADNFSYNGFYQSSTSAEITKSVQLFAATNDFKQTLQNQLDENILFLLSKTHGNNIVALQVLTLKPLSKNETTPIIKQTLQSALTQTTPQDFSYTVNTMDNFNHTTKAGIETSRFFTLVFGTSLIIYSLIFLLKSYYKQN